MWRIGRITNSELRIKAFQSEEYGVLCGLGANSPGEFVHSQVCVKVDQQFVSYYGKERDERGNLTDKDKYSVGDELCMCAFAVKWHYENGRKWRIRGEASPMCAVEYLYERDPKSYKVTDHTSLTQTLNLVESGNKVHNRNTANG